VLSIANSSTGTTADAISATTAGTTGAAIRGVATATTAGSNTAGVVGTTSAPTGSGVGGANLSTTGTNFGVAGLSNSVAGYGVYGVSPFVGTYGQTNTSGTTTAGVLGVNNSTDDKNPVRGVVGRANGTSQGIGVYGEASTGIGLQGSGVVGVDASGSFFGVRGVTNNESGAGGYFDNVGGGWALRADGSSLFEFIRSTSSIDIDGDASIDGNASIVGNTSMAGTVNFASSTSVTSTTDGPVTIGPTSGNHVTLDNNEIQAKGAFGSTNSDLFVNYWGGTTNIGNSGGGFFFVPTLAVGNDRVGINRNAITYDLEVGGNASKSTAGSWLANSDARIKKDVSTINNGIATIKQLRPVSFRYTNQYLKLRPEIKDRVYLNFIAQEYQQVFPNAVITSNEMIPGDPDPILTIDTHDATITTIKAVQELIEKVETLEKENASLRKSNEVLQGKISQLESTKAAPSDKEMQSTLEQLQQRLAALEALLHSDKSATTTS